jgi:excisionase family DNA binding protein
MDLLTTNEVAARMGRSRRWVQNLILRGKLKGEMKGGNYLVKASDVDRYEHQPAHRPSKNGASRPKPSKKRRRRAKAK